MDVFLKEMRLIYLSSHLKKPRPKKINSANVSSMITPMIGSFFLTKAQSWLACKYLSAIHHIARLIVQSKQLKLSY